MRTLLLIIVLGCFSCVCGQTPEERVQQVLTNLECKESKRATAYEGFVDAVKRGERGDGVRYPWMDKMRQLGIKQVFFVIRFEYRNGEYKYKVKEIDYLRRYYCYEGEVKGGNLLRQIRKSGLESELKEAIVAQIKRYERKYQTGNVKEGDEYHYLLDDEYLPVISFVT
ncbi:MAG: hypothetical protein WKF74_02960 [Pyrinomonadaceae bacterium]